MAKLTLGQVGKTKPIQTQYKPNSNPTSEKRKMNVSNVITKDYANKSQSEPKAKQAQSKPKKPNFSRRSLWRSRIKPNPPDPNNRLKTLIRHPENMHQKKLNIFQKNPCKGKTNNT